MDQTGTWTCELGDLGSDRSAATQIEVRVIPRQTTGTNSASATTGTVKLDASDDAASATVKVT